MDNALLMLEREVIDVLQHTHEFSQLCSGVFLPALLDRLLVVGSGGLEEE